MQETQLMISVEKARNEIRFAVNRASATYNLPGFIIDLIVQSIMAEELQQRMSLIAEQTSFEEKKGEEGAKTNQDDAIDTEKA